jgi:hypothetical protein
MSYRRDSKSMFCAGATVALALRSSLPAEADSFDAATQYHNVNSWILSAIAAHETGFKPHTIARNSNNTVDLGMFGVNSVRLAELARYGVSQSDLIGERKLRSSPAAPGQASAQVWNWLDSRGPITAPRYGIGTVTRLTSTG